MKTRTYLSVVTLSLIALVLLCGFAASAQDQVAQQPTTSAVPNLIRYGGVLKDANGAALASQTVGITFALYKQQEGGVALWTETRNVTTDAAGQYNVMLGSTKPEGVPAELFSDQEQRYLAVQVQGQPEPTRVLLVSVPYAFKAHEAETLGGLPASAFAKSAPDAGSSGSADAGITVNASSATASGKTASSGGQTQSASKDGWVRSGQVLKLTTDTDKVGIGTSNPRTKLEVVGDIHASGKISSGNATVTLNGLENAITVDSVPPTSPGLANQLYIGGEDASGTTPFDKIQVGIGTKTIGINKLQIFDKVFPVIGLTGPTSVGGAEWAIATCPGCFSNFAQVGDTVLRTGAGNSKNLIFTVRGSQGGAIKFGTGPTASETEKMTLLNNGNFGIGSNNPPTTFAVGDFTNPTDKSNPPFQVNYLGDMVRIKKISYLWPTTQPTLGQVLTAVTGTNSTQGVLAWTTLLNGTVQGSCTNPVTGGTYLPTWLGSGPGASTTVGCSSLFQQTGTKFIGILTTNPSKALDVNGEINARKWYDIGFPETSVLSIGSAVNFANNNVFVGISAGENFAGSPSTGTDNAFIGFGAGANNSGSQNTYSGSQAGFHATNGVYNTFAGYEAGYGATPSVDNTGSYNTFAGYWSGYFNTTGAFNTFSGTYSGRSNTTGSGNVFSGHAAGDQNQSGGGNSFYGYYAGLFNNDGGNNTCLGSITCETNVSGSGNTVVGAGAGGNFRGSNNIFVGNNAGLNDYYNYPIGSDGNIYVGSKGCTTGIGCYESNIIRIGNLLDTTFTQQNKVFFEPILAHPGGGDDMVTINVVTGQLGHIASSRRFKEQIAGMGDSTSGLMKLRPVKYFYKSQYDDGSHVLQYGLIAEEVAEVYPEMVARDKEGQPYSVRYQMLAPMLLNELQKQHAVVTAQQTEVQALREQTKAQQQQMLAQQKEIEGLKAQLQLQNAAFQERLSRLESLVTTQMQTAVADKTVQSAHTGGGMQ